MRVGSESKGLVQKHRAAEEKRGERANKRLRKRREKKVG